MLYFEGEGYIYKNNEKIIKTRDQIIKSGWKNNANIPKVNKILKRFHARELTDIEILEYVIRNSESSINFNSPVPKLSDFGLTENDIENINNKEKIIFFTCLCVFFIGGYIVVKYSENYAGTLFVQLIAGSIISICIWSLRNNNEYVENRRMFKTYKRVIIYYKRKYDEFQHKEREKERRKQEELKRQEERRRKEEILRKQRELREQKNYWYNLNPYDFEEKIGELFRDLGYEVTVTPKSGDGGIDAIIQKGNIIKAVQCKRYKAKLTEPAVRDLWGAKDYVKLKGKVVKADGAIMVALSGVTPQAKEFINHFSEYELWTIDTILTKANLANYNYTKK